MIGIVESRADEASVHICEHLRRVGDFEERSDDDRPDAEGGGTVWRSEAFELRSFDDLHLELDAAAAAFDDPELLVFASRHSGDTGPLLSAHPTGNFGDAEYGGEDRSLARAPPNALARILDALADNAPEGYDVAMECTHHGPTAVDVPSMFVELGSGPEEWDDPNGAAAVARGILDLAGVAADAAAARDADGTDSHRHVVGFGGGHYAPRFTRIARETDWAVGHVAADWSLEELGDPEVHSNVVDLVFERSAAEFAVVEGSKPVLEAVIEDLGYRIVSETWVQETSGVPLWLVEGSEELVGSVDDGLRFGAPARHLDESAEGGLSRIDLPVELLDTAAGIDADATMVALEENCVAFDTDEHGNRPGERAIVTGGSLPQALVGKLAAILRKRFDSLSVEADRIVAEETAFSPELAIEAGVPEGPKFGKLSGGEAVEVDGETVAPEAVHERRRIEFDLS